MQGIGIEILEGPYQVASESGWVEDVYWAEDLQSGEKGVMVTFRGNVTCFYPGTPHSWVSEIENGGGSAVHGTVYGYSYIRVQI